MKLLTALATGATVLAVGGGVFAAQAVASPPTPTPQPTTSSTTGAGTARHARLLWFYGALTDVQRQCLADANVHRPSGKLTDQQTKDLQAQVTAALSSCGVTVPARLADRPRLGFAWASLTADQQHCLATQQLTRPVGRLTESERATVRQEKLDAGAACGIGG